MTLMIVALLIALCGSAVAPHAFLRGDERRRYALLHVSVTGVAAIVLAIAPALGISVDSNLIAASVVAVALILVGIVLLASDHDPVDERGGAFAFLPLCVVVFAVALAPVSRIAADGDEPYYLLQATSLRADGDLDLRNQYANVDARDLGRADVAPQLGDPVGRSGEQYSRHEPLLSMLLLPAHAVAGRFGAQLTMTGFALLFAVSLYRLLAAEGVQPRARLLTLLLVVCGAPVVFYSVRIWPEVPGALFLCEALRAVRAERRGRAGLWLLLLSLLKLRFATIAAPLLLLTSGLTRKGWKRAAIVMAVAAVPLAVLWLVTGNALNVHTLSEFKPQPLTAYWRGLFGLLIDGQHGMLFIAPAVFFALVAALVHRDDSRLLRLVALAALPYLLLLAPRTEWHGGWSPPMRYLVVFGPVFGLVLARAIEARWHRALLTAVAIWSAGVFIHGVAYPWRLFHIQDGEATWSEFLSSRSAYDYSRLVPSFVRVNDIAVQASCALVIAVGVVALARGGRERRLGAAAPLVLTVLVATFFVSGRAAGKNVHFEDAHVQRSGGELSPEYYRVARFLYVSGWRVNAGDALRFRLTPGPARLYYASVPGARISLGTQVVDLPPTAGQFHDVGIVVPETNGFVELKMMTGEAVLDRIGRD